jgi:acetyl-CoA carboxylase biotin carboxyl carrier protein
MTDIVEYCTDRLPELLRLLAGSDVQLLEITDGETQVRIRRALQGVEADVGVLDESPVQSEPLTEYITSPLVGTFYRAGAPGSAPLADTETEVDVETVVGYVEVLGESIEVPAGRRGVIIDVLRTDGDAVAYGDALFAVRAGG